MKTICFALLLSAGLSLGAGAAEAPLPLFRQANSLYEKGDYAEAIRIYESLKAFSPGDAAFFYNLGNAYFRAGDMGRAVLHYERAFRRAPRDGEIRENLAFARRLVKEPPLAFYDAFRAWAGGLATPDELAVLCSLLLFLLAGGIVAFLFTGRRGLAPATIAAGMLFLIAAGWFLVTVTATARIRWAIVIDGPREVRNGPTVESSVGFSLPAGRKVMILGERGNWVAVGGQAEGLKGWTEKEALEEIGA